MLLWSFSTQSANSGRSPERKRTSGFGHPCKLESRGLNFSVSDR
jgi:hypothetical protein